MSNLICWVASGDSITGPANSWPYQYLNVSSIGDASFPDLQAACTYYGTNIIMRDMAIDGSHLGTIGGVYPDLVQLAPVYIDPIVTTKSVASQGGGTAPRKRKYFFTCSIGSNDEATGGFATPALYAAAVASCCVARKNVGYDLCAMSTLLPRGDNTMTEPNRLAYNSTLTGANWTTTNGIDYIIDFARQTFMGNPANLPVNGGGTTYFQSDNIHPTTFGQSLLVPIFAAVMTSVLALP